MTPSGRLSTLSSGQGPGFEWQGSVQSDRPHSSLSPPSSTALQGGSWCCSSCSGRPSPGTPGLWDTPEELLLPPTFQPRLQAEGKPPLARHTRVALPCCSSSLEGGRTVRVGRTTPTGGERGEKRQRDEDEGKWRTGDFLFVIKWNRRTSTVEHHSLSVRPSAAGFKCQCGWEGSLIMIIDDYWWRLHVCFSTCDSE